MSKRPYDVFQELKEMLVFDQDDERNLVELQRILGPEIPGITDRFYAVLLRRPETAAFVDGRVEELKKAHVAWFEDVLQGTYGEPFFDRQYKIGMAHVRIGLLPHWVEGIMCFIRTESIAAIERLVSDSARAAALTASLVRILDLNLAVINLSYHETRLRNLTSMTGMKRELLENLILHG